ncbi:exodeoxyribonuclease I [Candidatus Saccharibacteria bacterium]|nr:MAG: exodeoxyribonuclease I [Candidatus Saccharibacteria bacterium]
MREPTFFWYDLETSGINPREDRIMQFAGQRTTLGLEQIGEPVNVLIKMSDDVLPQPDAVLLTGITPQQTIADGLTERDFLRLFHDEIALPGTVFVGFNSVRFDDEFMRFLHYRNFYDPYEWQWKDDRGRWDLLDVVRMTRALRPAGMKWPVVDGKPGNRLESLAKANGIEHSQAHDALADVRASMEIAQLIRTNQPKLFDWLLNMRKKSQVKQLVEKNEPFVYSSGKYDNAAEKTTVAIRLAEHPKKQGALVYDLRHDPTPFLDMPAEKLAERWKYNREPDAPPRLPVKTMQFNRCPAIAPLSVLDADSQKRIQLTKAVVDKHKTLLQANQTFPEVVLKALALLDADQAERRNHRELSPDAQLYDGFYDDADERLLAVARTAQPSELTPDLSSRFHDKRLSSLLPLFKARNFPSAMNEEERTAWESHRRHMLFDGGEQSRLSQFMHRLSELAKQDPNNDKRFLLEELQLYAESIMPAFDV